MEDCREKCEDTKKGVDRLVLVDDFNELVELRDVSEELDDEVPQLPNRGWQPAPQYPLVDPH